MVIHSIWASDYNTQIRSQMPVSPIWLLYTLVLNTPNAGLTDTAYVHSGHHRDPVWTICTSLECYNSNSSTVDPRVTRSGDSFRKGPHNLYMDEIERLVLIGDQVERKERQRKKGALNSRVLVTSFAKMSRSTSRIKSIMWRKTGRCHVKHTLWLEWYRMAA